MKNIFKYLKPSIDFSCFRIIFVLLITYSPLKNSHMDKTLNGSMYLLNQMELCKKELIINCNDGGVIINTLSLDFTYIGKWGSAVLMHIIKNNVMSKKDVIKQIIVLSAHMERYAQNNGGMTVTIN